jgi:hypothetical protein
VRLCTKFNKRFLSEGIGVRFLHGKSRDTSQIRHIFLPDAESRVDMELKYPIVVILEICRVDSSSNVYACLGPSQEGIVGA